MRVGANTYTQNTPAARVYEITECRADLYNGGSAYFDDINPFVLALSNPAGFPTRYPGLGGGMVFHGDLDCDPNQTVDFHDVNPFVLRLAERCCQVACGHCPEPIDELPSPAELAALLTTYTELDLYDAMVDLVAATAEAQSDPDDQAYWEAVYEALMP